MVWDRFSPRLLIATALLLGVLARGTGALLWLFVFAQGDAKKGDRRLTAAQNTKVLAAQSTSTNYASTGTNYLTGSTYTVRVCLFYCWEETYTRSYSYTLGTGTTGVTLVAYYSFNLTTQAVRQDPAILRAL